METSASFEARSAPSSYPTQGTLIVILGLCGSGKSCLIAGLEADLKFDEGFAWNRYGELDQLTEALRAGKRCIVIEIEYCFAEQRDRFVRYVKQAVPGVRIQWKCFENDVDKANANCLRRPDRDAQRHFGINQRLSAGYTFPDGAEVIPIWTPERNP